MTVQIDQFGAENWPQHLAPWRIEQDRHSLRAPVHALTAEFNEAVGDRRLKLGFTLDSGCYATAFLRELIQLSPE
ncbi:MAG: hypothetical protein ACYC3A_04695 [Halothiobacillus sp.]